MSIESTVRHDGKSVWVGFLCWLTILGTIPESPLWSIRLLLLFAPLVIVPLGMSLLVRRLHKPPREGEWQALGRLQLPAALSLAASFYIPAWSIPLAIPWLGWTGWLFGLRLLDWASRKSLAFPLISDMAAATYLPVGAAWAIAHHAGLQPLEFSETIVLLTAVHFHYAGFAFPLIAGRIAEAGGSRIATLAGAVAIVAVPLVALGITLTQLTGSHLAEGLSAWVLAVAGILLAWHQVRLDSRGWTRLLLMVSALSLAIALTWSAIYAGARMSIWSGVDIPFMMRWHGVVNAIGFVLVGLIAWNRREKCP